MEVASRVARSELELSARNHLWFEQIESRSRTPTGDGSHAGQLQHRRQEATLDCFQCASAIAWGARACLQRACQRRGSAQHGSMTWRVYEPSELPITPKCASERERERDYNAFASQQV